MSWEYIEEVSLMFALLMGCSFCSAAETSYSTADIEKLKAMGQKKIFGSKLAVKMSARFDSVLTSILIANTVICIALSSVGAVVFGDLIQDDEYGAAISGALLTVLVLIFGEISPKLMAKDAAEKVACFLAYPLYIMIVLLTPCCHLVALWKRLLMLIFKLKPEEK